MTTLDPAALPINAAGIADAFRRCQFSDDDGAARSDDLSAQYNGWIGVVEEIAYAAEMMERFRIRHGTNAAWGAELPYIYDVWDAIAQALWDHLGNQPVDVIVETAISASIEEESVPTD